MNIKIIFYRNKIENIFAIKREFYCVNKKSYSFKSHSTNLIKNKSN